MHGNVPLKCFKIKDESLTIFVDVDEPYSYEEGFDSPASKKWLGVMEKEMCFMMNNQVWELADPPLGSKTIGNRWVLKNKHKAYRSINKYKV